MVLFDFRGNLYDMADSIKKIANYDVRQKKEFNIKTITDLFTFLESKKKVFDVRPQIIRTLVNINRTNEYECKSACAAVLAVLPYTQIIYVAQESTNKFNHVANVFNSQKEGVIIVDASIQKIMPFSEYVKLGNILNFAVMQ